MPIPDAPWIRDAETNGYPDPPAVECPCCGEECSEIYGDQYGNVVGCDRCIMVQDALEWQDERRQADIDEEMERRLDR